MKKKSEALYTVTARPIGAITPYSRNPRHNESAIAAVARSLKHFGFRKPLVVDAKGVIICGHTTYAAAKSLGLAKVPVHVATDLTPKQVRAYRIADNKTGEIATWDLDLLPSELADVQKSGYDLADFGFGADELRALLAPAGDAADPDQVPPPPAKPQTRMGDLWILGEHRLLCGDCTKAADVQRVMGESRAVLMNTDPPYGVAYTDEVRVAAERAHGRQQRAAKWADGIPNDGKTGADIQPFLESCFRAACASALAPKAAWYLWHAHLTQGFFAAAAAAAANVVLSRQIIWVKPCLLFGFGDYHWRHELCFYGWVKGSKPPFYGERNQTTVWELTHETSNGNRAHPTQKPVELFSIPLVNHTKAGEVCYEPFCGSGSQIVAAEQLGRRCCAIEIEPKYVDVAVARWEKFTGRQAVRAGDRAAHAKTTTKPAA